MKAKVSVVKFWDSFNLVDYVGIRFDWYDVFIWVENSKVTYTYKGQEIEPTDNLWEMAERIVLGLAVNEPVKEKHGAGMNITQYEYEV